MIEVITGGLVPAAFHANEGATGARKVYLEQMGLRHCYSLSETRSALILNCIGESLGWLPCTLINL